MMQSSNKSTKQEDRVFRCSKLFNIGDIANDIRPDYICVLIFIVVYVSAQKRADISIVVLHCH